MLAKLPINKNQLLIVGTVLLLLISYKLAFKSTFEAWQTNKKLKAQVAQTNNVSYQPDYLNRKTHNLDKVINAYKVDTATFRSNCVNKAALIAAKENVKLSDVPAPNTSLKSDKLMIQKIRLEGSYFSLIKVLHCIQNTAGIGMIRSTNVIIIRNSNNLTDRLFADIFLEIAR